MYFFFLSRRFFIFGEAFFFFFSVCLWRPNGGGKILFSVFWNCLKFFFSTLPSFWGPKKGKLGSFSNLQKKKGGGHFKNPKIFWAGGHLFLNSLKARGKNGLLKKNF